MVAFFSALIQVNSDLKTIGALAGLAAVPGLAVLSLLYFGQAREVQRLREWAGRAPERAAELEQRVSADAQRRIQAQPVPRPATPAPAPAAGPPRRPAGPPPAREAGWQRRGHVRNDAAAPDIHPLSLHDGRQA